MHRHHIATWMFKASLVGWTGVFAVVIIWHRLFDDSYTSVKKSALVWIRGVARLLRVFCKLDYEVFIAPSILNLEEPRLYVANHQSAWETILFFLIFPDVAIVAKKELFAVPIFGWYLAKLGMIPVDRLAPEKNKAMLKAARAAFRQGRSVLIFPEGTRVPYGERSTYNTSGAEALLKLGERVTGRTPTIVPVAHNSGKFWPPRAQVIVPGKIAVMQMTPVADINSAITAINAKKHAF